MLSSIDIHDGSMYRFQIWYIYLQDTGEDFNIKILFLQGDSLTNNNQQEAMLLHLDNFLKYYNYCS